MAIYTFKEYEEHLGHRIELVAYMGYGKGNTNIAIECLTCGMVLIDLNEDEQLYKE